MKRLLRFFRDYKKEIVLAPTFKLLEAVFELFVPLVMAAIIDRGIAEADRGLIGRMSLVLVVLAAIGLTVSVTAQFFAAKAAVGVSAKMRQALFEHIQRFDFTHIDAAGSSAMITRMTSDVNQVQSGVNMVLRLFLRSPIIVFGAMIMAFTIDVKSALVFVVAIPVLAVVVFGIMWITMPLYKKVQKALEQVLRLTRENLTGVRVIRAFCEEEAETVKFEEHTEKLAGLQTFVGRISAIMNPVTFIIVNAATIVLIYTGAIQVNVGTLTQGEVIAIVNYMSQILVELVKFANLMITITKALACADRVADVFEIPGTDVQSLGMIYGETTAQREAPFVAFDHVSYRYPGAGDETLKDIHFKVQKGETVGIIGSTGSGKTTLVQLLAGLYPVTEGTVSVSGVDVNEMDTQTLRNMIGMVPQKAVLFEGTIESNLAFGKEDATQEEMWMALERAQIKSVIEEKGGLRARVAQNGKNLSGGQRQRVTIARALVRNPEILILDDSASALDYATEAALRRAIQEYEGSTTTFIVSQRASSVRHADKILVLDDGELAGVGTHDELLVSCPVYQEIYESQYSVEESVEKGDRKS